MSIGSLFGSVPVEGRRWAPQLIIGGDVSPAEEFIVDPFLPPIATDPLDPRRSVVIPNGRLVAVGNFSGVGRGSNTFKFDFKGMPDGMGYKSWITLHNGRDTNPAGIAPYRMFKFWPEHPYNTPVTYRKHALCVVPYVAAYNDANGVLLTGDRITGYFGSSTTTGSINPIHVGKPVKWVEKKSYLVTVAGAGSGTVALAAATLPGITPKVVFAGSNASAFVAVPGNAYWVAAAQCWYADFAASVNFCLYEYGQDADQIAGEVVRIENLYDMSQHDSWSRWVEDNYAAWEAGPMLTRVPTQLLGTVDPSGATKNANCDWETLTFTAGVATLAHKPVDFRQQITIMIVGSYIDENGSTVTCSSWTALPGAGGMFQDYSQSKYYSINYLTGQIAMSSNVSITLAVIKYNYEVGYEQGKLWGAGQLNLTDASQSGATLNPEGLSNGVTYLGLPSHLDVTGVVGELRFIVY